MEIDKVFSASRMAETKVLYDLWWEQKTERPVAGVMVKNRVPDLPKPKYPLLSQSNCNDWTIPLDGVLDAIEYELCSYEYIGDSYPLFRLDCFGPGIIAAILGAVLDNSTGNVWFKPGRIRKPEDLHLSFNEDNPWFLRLKALMERASERFEGRLLLSMPDIGGILDILAVFRPGELLLYDLHDYPEQIKILCGQIFQCWKEIYTKFSEYLRMEEFGYTDWSSLLSSEPSYVIQSDFSYMIGTDMFTEFELPNLAGFCSLLPRTMYHMDGSGQIRHLEKLLKLPGLKAIQWVPGDGSPPCGHYRELYERIERAGMNIQIPGDSMEQMAVVAQFLEKP
ncbi:hypothetical protein GCM10008922_05080 [Faecalicatena contorta]|jgi:hypothetical protein|uniref:hypothetical protein n=1 Tax=Faecalicatena contorta TaxID=39482 RepID=UPI0031E38AE8